MRCASSGSFRAFNLRMVPVPTWKIWLLGLVGGTIALTFVVAAAGLFLLLLPVVLVAGVVARLLRRLAAEVGPGPCRRGRRCSKGSTRWSRSSAGPVAAGGGEPVPYFVSVG